MSTSTIDVADPMYWGFVLAAVVVLRLLPAAGTARRAALLLVDATFAAALLGWRGLLAVSVAALVFTAAVRAVHQRGPGWRVRLGVAWGGAVLAFAVHKAPGEFGAPALRAVFVALGLSYVVLRAVEVLRAAAEGRGECPRWLDVPHYLVPFHMLSAGPIQAWDDFIAASAVPRTVDRGVALVGLDRIARGLFKKFVLAFFVERAFFTGFAADGAAWWVELQAYYVWVWLDFSAYSDLAVGIGMLMGLPTPENFNAPLRARNLIDFWDRWHMSLSLWIRRNIFIPAQLALMRSTGGERPLLTSSVALAASFVACGAWHGLTLRFIAWGAIHAGAVVVTNAYRAALRRRLGAKGVQRYMSRPTIRWVATILTFEFVALSLWFVAPSRGSHGH